METQFIGTNDPRSFVSQLLLNGFNRLDLRNGDPLIDGGEMSPGRGGNLGRGDESLFRVPVLGWLLKRYDCLPVPRESVAPRRSLEICVEALQKDLAAREREQQEKKELTTA